MQMTREAAYLKEERQWHAVDEGGVLEEGIEEIGAAGAREVGAQARVEGLGNGGRGRAGVDNQGRGRRSTGCARRDQRGGQCGGG